MTVLEQHAALARSLEFSIERLKRREEKWNAQSGHVAILRLGLVVGGIFAAVVAALYTNALIAWSIVAMAFLLFVGVALYHRRIDQWIETLRLAREIRADRLARLQLAWDDLPLPRPITLNAANKALARDLDLVGARSLHQLLDTTISRHGTQRLADWLTQTRPDVDALTKRQAIVRDLAPRARFREHFQLTYQLVMKRELEGDNLLEWLKAEPSSHLGWTLVVALVLVAANLVLFALSYFGILPPFWLGTLAIYVMFYFSYQKDLEAALQGLERVNAELEKFRALLRYLERASYDNAAHLAELCAPFREQTHPPSEQLRRVGAVTVAVGLRSNPYLGLLLNLVLPWDFVCAFLANRARRAVAQTLPMWVETIHELDALIALANFAALHPESAMPEIRADAAPVLRARHLGHPLLHTETRVCNDFEITTLGQTDILTGSNMAGKSTFLKTVGVNLCLAYAGAPVIAASFLAQPFRLHTCIRITDSIVDGFSYFYAEVKCLKALLEELHAPDELPVLYLIDEIFRGTNNRERLVGSRAYIETLLHARGVGLIATHDLELAQLANANPNAHNYHFRDEVSDGRLVFDYRLRAGACPTTNALKIMALEGLPVEPHDA